jgi:ABC-type proline/glycine betaine transport system substrate-binding protein
MKKVFTILVAAAFVSFTSCKNAPKAEECGSMEEVTFVEDEFGDEIEEVEEEPAK